MVKDWYVAKVKPHKESFLIDYLSSKGVEVYFPKILRPSKRGQIIEPLFPTYLFCLCDPLSPGWPMVRWAPGLSYFLGSDSMPSPVSQTLIAYLRSRVGWWNDEGCKQRLMSGERVRVIGGPLEGLEGIFQTYVSARQRCQVLLHTVKRLVAAELPEAQLEAVTSGRFRLLTLPSTS